LATLSISLSSFLLTPVPPTSTRFPYTTLFRSTDRRATRHVEGQVRVWAHHAVRTVRPRHGLTRVGGRAAGQFGARLVNEADVRDGALARRPQCIEKRRIHCHARIPRQIGTYTKGREPSDDSDESRPVWSQCLFQPLIYYTHPADSRVTMRGTQAPAVACR